MVSVRRGFASFSVDDVDAARRFYEDVLGLRVTAAADSLILHLEGGTTVFVYPKEDHAAATFTVFHLSVDDVDAVVDELAAKGHEPLRYDAFEHDENGVVRGFMEGGDGAWFADPAGNVVGFMDGESSRVFEEATGS
jgi:catechol 2,3-dioxygenase-like lactoylglutathione lyase family enzyme